MGVKLGTTIDHVIRGDTRQINLTFLQSDGITAINLAGGTVYFTVQSTDNPTDDSTALMFQKTVAGSSATSPSAGKHTFTLTHANTNIAPGTYWYDAEFVDSTGNYVSSYRGKFVVQSDITRT